MLSKCQHPYYFSILDKAIPLFYFYIPVNDCIFYSLLFVSLESHNQWGRPGCPQGAAMGSSGEEAEGEANSLINQTVAAAIAGTATPTPMSRPSSFLLNSQVF